MRHSKLFKHDISVALYTTSCSFEFLPSICLSKCLSSYILTIAWGTLNLEISKD